MTVNTGGAEQVEIERLHRKLTNAQANLNTMTELNSNQAATIESMQRCIVSLEGRLTLAKDEAKLHDIAFDAVQARVEELEADKVYLLNIQDELVKQRDALTTVEAGYIEEHAEITKEQWDSIKTTVEGE